MEKINTSRVIFNIKLNKWLTIKPVYNPYIGRLTR